MISEEARVMAAEEFLSSQPDEGQAFIEAARRLREAQAAVGEAQRLLRQAKREERNAESYLLDNLPEGTSNVIPGRAVPTLIRVARMRDKGES